MSTEEMNLLNNYSDAISQIKLTKRLHVESDRGIHMARKRIKVKKIREILKHNCSENLSIRQIAKLTGVSKTVVSEYLSTFKKRVRAAKKYQK